MAQSVTSEPSWGTEHRFDLALFAGVLAALAFGLWIVGVPLPSGCNFHAATQFAGSRQHLGELANKACRRLTHNDARLSLWYDSAFAVMYGVLLFECARRWWRSWRVDRIRRLRVAVMVLGPAAALCDLSENLSTAIGLSARRGLAFRNDTVATVVSSFALVKWLLLLVTAIAVLAGFWSTIAPRARHLDDENAHDPPCWDDTLDAELGVCCSGGGIRAAAYSVGALQALEEAHYMDRARWLAAVSGGAYAATGWTLRRNHGVPDPAANLHADLFAGKPKNPAHRYLASGRGGFARALLKALLVVLFNLVAIALAIVAFAWPLGRLLSSEAVQPSLGDKPLPRLDAISFDAHRRAPHAVIFAAQHWKPGVVLLAAAIALLVLRAALPQGGRTWTTPVAAGFGVVGAAHLVVFVALPVMMVALHQVLEVGDWRGLQVAIPASALFVITAVWKRFSGRLAKLAPRLGGVGLAAGVIISAGWIATRAAQRTWPWQMWLVPTLVFVALFCFVPIQWASLRPLYRDGLRRAFTVSRAGDATVCLDQLKWDEIRAATPGVANNVPELVICAASQQIGLAPGGIPATSFTISPVAVRAHLSGAGADGNAMTTNKYLAAVPQPFQGQLHTVSAWMAVTGAAFSSAMGRGGYGTTNALMAALNIDLGAWIPNPKLVARGATRFPRIRLGYLVKEVFGIYDSEDQNVFVSDGGQWENLGLVELFRRQCTTIVCLDASGDGPGTFTTLRQALDLAAGSLSLNVILAPDVSALTGAKGELAQTATARWRFSYAFADGTTRDGTLLYAKLQSASDQPAELVRYASIDPEFPHYSTENQFLESEQVEHLIEVGYHAAGQLVDLETAAMSKAPEAIDGSEYPQGC